MLIGGGSSLFLKVGGGLNEPGRHLWIGSRLCHFGQRGRSQPRVDAIFGHCTAFVSFIA
jgi:hypothetical protein